MFILYPKVQEILAKTEGIQRLIDGQEQFDLVFLTSFCLDLGLYLAKEKFDWPAIYIHPAMSISFVDNMIGNPVFPSYMPAVMLPYGQEMTFYQRLLNTLASKAITWSMEWYLLPKTSQKMKEVFHLDQAPDLVSLSYEVDMLFLNTQPLFDSVAPKNPNSIMIGGMHLHPAQPIQDRSLLDFIEGAEHGVVFVSFGSVSDVIIVVVVILTDVSFCRY